MVLRKVVNHLVKNENRTLSNTIHKTKLKMDYRSKENLSKKKKKRKTKIPAEIITGKKARRRKT